MSILKHAAIRVKHIKKEKYETPHKESKNMHMRKQKYAHKKAHHEQDDAGLICPSVKINDLTNFHY